jgi:hypothetical protein
MSIIVAARKLCALLLLPSFLIGSSLLKAAEPQELSAAQLLFEPRPIPVAGTPEPEFVHVASALAAKQTNEASAPQQQLAEMTAAIAASDNETGAAADAKVEQLLQAGLLNARLQQHDAAITLLDRARTLSKITKGIDNTDQFQLMDALATSLAATARYEAADALQDEKLQLAEAAFGENSLEMAMALQQVGDWNLQAFLQRSNITLSIPRMNMQLLMINGLNAASSMQAAAGSMQRPRGGHHISEGQLAGPTDAHGGAGVVEEPRVAGAQHQVACAIRVQYAREGIQGVASAEGDVGGF